MFLLVCYDDLLQAEIEYKLFAGHDCIKWG